MHRLLREGGSWEGGRQGETCTAPTTDQQVELRYLKDPHAKQFVTEMLVPTGVMAGVSRLAAVAFLQRPR